MVISRSLVLGALALVSAATSGQEAQDVGRSTLSGLTGVRVYVEAVNPEAERDGVTTAALQTQVEVMLRQAKIRVLTVDEWNTTPGRPMLRVALTIVRNQNQRAVYAFNLEIEVAQSIVLARDHSVASFGRTWFDSNVVQLAEASAIRAAVRDSVQEEVEVFVNAFLAANSGR